MNFNLPGLVNHTNCKNQTLDTDMTSQGIKTCKKKKKKRKKAGKTNENEKKSRQKTKNRIIAQNKKRKRKKIKQKARKVSKVRINHLPGK